MSNRAYAVLFGSSIVIMMVAVMLGKAIGVTGAGVVLGVVVVITLISRFDVFVLSNGVTRVLITIGILAVLPFVAHLLDPDFGEAVVRRGHNNMVAVTNLVNKSNLKSEAEAGTFGTLTERTPIYNCNKKKYTVDGYEVVLPAGAVVMASNLRGLPATGQMQGLTQVIPKNKEGLYCDENVLYVPSKLIDWHR